ncbi:MAG: hypothetical protein Q8P08_02075 [bacterium]|nr:hypothetical protein [bacterium]
MKRFLENLDKYLKYYFLVSIISLAFALWLLYQRVDLISKVLQQKYSDFPQTVRELKEVQLQPIDECGEDCKKTIDEEVARAVATISASNKVTNLPSNQSSLKGETTYISLAGPFTSTATDWFDLSGVEAYIDLEKEYGKGASTAWEASLKVAHGNGQAFARLFDVTHGIAVSGSEISTTNNADSKLVTSGNLNLWAGRNLYRVQIKSLNSFEVTFGGGRIKIQY